MRILEVIDRATLDVERIPETEMQYRATILRAASTLQLSVDEAFDLLDRGHQLSTALYINRLVDRRQEEAPR